MMRQARVFSLRSGKIVRAILQFARNVYVLDTINPFMKTLTIPEDARNAYMFSDEYVCFSMSFFGECQGEPIRSSFQ